jgi:hypothetical protein
MGRRSRSGNLGIDAVNSWDTVCRTHRLLALSSTQKLVTSVNNTMWYTMTTLPPCPVLIQPRLSTLRPGTPSCRLESSVTSQTTSISLASPSLFPRSMTNGSLRKSSVITLNSPRATAPSLGEHFDDLPELPLSKLQRERPPTTTPSETMRGPRSSQSECGFNDDGGGSTVGDRDGAPSRSQPPLPRLERPSATPLHLDFNDDVPVSRPTTRVPVNEGLGRGMRRRKANSKYGSQDWATYQETLNQKVSRFPSFYSRK